MIFPFKNRELFAYRRRTIPVCIEFCILIVLQRPDILTNEMRNLATEAAGKNLGRAKSTSMLISGVDGSGTALDDVK